MGARPIPQSYSLFQRSDSDIIMPGYGLPFASIWRMGTLRSDMRTKRDEILELRKAGLSYAKIGDRLGISRQRVWGILNWKYVPKKRALDSKLALRCGEAAELLGIHPNTLRKWANRGILKCFRITPRGDRRFRKQEVEAFLKRGTAATSP